MKKIKLEVKIYSVSVSKGYPCIGSKVSIDYTRIIDGVDRDMARIEMSAVFYHLPEISVVVTRRNKNRILDTIFQELTMVLDGMESDKREIYGSKLRSKKILDQISKGVCLVREIEVKDCLEDLD